MAAMMLPSVAPTVALYSRMTRNRSVVLPLMFVGGYLVTWAAAGLAAFAVGAAGSAVAGTGLEWNHAGRVLAGNDPARGSRLPTVTAQGRVPRQVSQPARDAPRILARRGVGRSADGHEERRLVRRLLLGPDGVTVRSRSDERPVDGGNRRPDRHREDRAVGESRPPTARRSSCWRSASCSWPPPPPYPA